MYIENLHEYKILWFLYDTVKEGVLQKKDLNLKKIIQISNGACCKCKKGKGTIHQPHQATLASHLILVPSPPHPPGSITVV